MSTLFPEKIITSVETDVQWAEVFEKVAEQYKPKTYAEHRQIIEDLFHSNKQVMNKFGSWSEKVSFDKNKLKEIYANSIH